MQEDRRGSRSRESARVKLRLEVHHPFTAKLHHPFTANLHQRFAANVHQVGMMSTAISVVE
jgi:hypothetical protein